MPRWTGPGRSDLFMNGAWPAAELGTTAFVADAPAGCGRAVMAQFLDGPPGRRG